MLIDGQTDRQTERKKTDRQLPEFSSRTSDDIAFVTESAANSKSFRRFRLAPGSSFRSPKASLMSPSTPLSCLESGDKGESALPKRSGGELLADPLALRELLGEPA